jgi:hypothetical protein
MPRRSRGGAWRTSAASNGDDRPSEEAEDPFDDWERYPATEAEENVEYQKIAWYGAPFGDAGVALLVLAVIVNALRRGVRAAIRLLMR